MGLEASRGKAGSLQGSFLGRRTALTTQGGGPKQGKFDTMYVVSVGCVAESTEQIALWGLDKDHVSLQASVRTSVRCKAFQMPSRGSADPRRSEGSMKKAHDLLMTTSAAASRDCGQALKSGQRLIEQTDALLKAERDQAAQAAAPAAVPCFDAGAGGSSSSQQDQQQQQQQLISPFDVKTKYELRQVEEQVRKKKREALEDLALANREAAERLHKIQADEAKKKKEQEKERLAKLCVERLPQQMAFLRWVAQNDREALERATEERVAQERQAEEREAQKRQDEEREAQKRQAEEREAQKRQAEEREAQKRQSQELEVLEREVVERETEERVAQERKVQEREVQERLLAKLRADEEARWEHKEHQRHRRAVERAAEEEERQRPRQQQQPPCFDAEEKKEEDELEADFDRGASASETSSDSEDAAGGGAAAGKDDEVGQAALRRQGLPVRIFVQRSGDLFSWTSDAEGQLRLVDQVACVLDHRKAFIKSHDRDSPPVVRRKGPLEVLVREAQLAVYDIIFREWGEGEGAVYCSRTATSQKGHYKTHCFNTFGGKHWLKFLIAIGDVPAEAVAATNSMIADRTRERRGQETSTVPKLPDEERRWLRREDRPNPCFDAGSAKKLRRKAKELAVALSDFQDFLHYREDRITPHEQSRWSEMSQDLQEARRRASEASMASSHEPGRPVD